MNDIINKINEEIKLIENSIIKHEKCHLDNREIITGLKIAKITYEHCLNIIEANSVIEAIDLEFKNMIGNFT